LVTRKYLPVGITRQTREGGGQTEHQDQPHHQDQIKRQRDRETERQRDRETGAERERVCVCQSMAIRRGMLVGLRGSEGTYCDERTIVA
jgi:hypothetical protein